eukprot:GHVS01076365.1.p1 GENE.GHVS01076365.1~~GHVS01076365.1.p1  ORF type:complete len:569 (-),score=78.03 GHVS01076365.1:132-1700(-)
MSKILSKHKVFIDLCPHLPDGTIAPPDGGYDDFACNEQDGAVQGLFTVTMTAHFAMSAVAGGILDKCGMKLTAIVGMFLHTLAWLLIAFCPPVEAAYYPAFIILGAACDTGHLPGLPVANLFPGSYALIITILGSASSICWAVPVVMYKVWDANPQWSFQYICIGYLLVGVLPSTLIAIFTMPWKTFQGIDQFPDFLGPAAESIPPNLEHSQSDNSKSSPTTPPIPSSLSITSQRSIVSQGYSGLSTDPRSDPKSEDQEVRRRSSAKYSPLEVQKQDTSTTISIVLRKKGCRSSGFFFQICSIEYLCICTYFVCVSLSVAYYSAASGGSKLFPDHNTKNLLEILTPLSFIPCIILGKLIDFFGIMIILFVVCSFGLLSFLFVAIRSTVTSYLSVIFFCFYISLLTSQLYCYVALTFDSRHFGKLVGTATLLGGVMALLALPLYNQLTLKVFGTVQPICWIFVGLLAVMFAVIEVMAWRRRKNPHRFTHRPNHQKTPKELETQNTRMKGGGEREATELEMGGG